MAHDNMAQDNMAQDNMAQDNMTAVQTYDSESTDVLDCQGVFSVLPAEVEILVFKLTDPASLAKLRRVNKACLKLIDEVIVDKVAIPMAEEYLKNADNLQGMCWNLNWAHVPDRADNLKDPRWVYRYTLYATEQWSNLNVSAYLRMLWSLFERVDSEARDIEEHLELAKAWWVLPLTQ